MALVDMGLNIDLFVLFYNDGVAFPQRQDHALMAQADDERPLITLNGNRPMAQPDDGTGVTRVW